MKKKKNIDNSSNTYKEMKTTKFIDHSNKPYSQEKLEVPQTPSPEGHSQQANKPSKCDSENGNIMTELDRLGSTTQSFSDEIIMSPIQKAIFLGRLFQMKYRIVRFSHKTGHLKCAINWKITLNT